MSKLNTLARKAGVVAEAVLDAVGAILVIAVGLALGGTFLAVVLPIGVCLTTVGTIKTKLKLVK